MPTVYAIQCLTYDRVSEKIDTLLAMMGGIERFVGSGERIALKPNLLAAMKPEQAGTTHPSVVAAIGRLTAQAGATPVIIDSPGSGYPHTEKMLNKVYRATGMYAAAVKNSFGIIPGLTKPGYHAKRSRRESKSTWIPATRPYRIRTGALSNAWKYSVQYWKPMAC